MRSFWVSVFRIVKALLAIFFAVAMLGMCGMCLIFIVWGKPPDPTCELCREILRRSIEGRQQQPLTLGRDFDPERLCESVGPRVSPLHAAAQAGDVVAV